MQSTQIKMVFSICLNENGESSIEFNGNVNIAKKWLLDKEKAWKNPLEIENLLGIWLSFKRIRINLCHDSHQNKWHKSINTNCKHENVFPYKKEKYRLPHQLSVFFFLTENGWNPVILFATSTPLARTHTHELLSWNWFNIMLSHDV